MQTQDTCNDFVSTFDEFITERINSSNAIQKHPDYNSALFEAEKATRKLKEKLPQDFWPLLHDLESAYLSLTGTACFLGYKLGLRDGARLDRLLAG